MTETITEPTNQPVKRLKICIAITKSNWGGAQRYVYDLAVGLPSHTYDVVVVAGGDGPLLTRLKDASIRTIPLTSLGRDIGLFKDIRSFFNLKKILKTERPDVLHLNSSKMGLLGSLTGRISRIPRIIFTAHGWAFTEQRPAWQKAIFFIMHSVTLFLSHITIAVSEETRNYMKSIPFVQKKISVIHNGIDIPDFLNKEEAREKLLSSLPTEIQDALLKDDALWVGTISELHTNKGLSFALQALAEQNKDKNRNTKSAFLIIGSGESESILRAEAQELGLHDRVFFLGHIPDASRYLKAFNIFTLTSITEGLPYVLLEAGAAGLPVVASAVGGIGEIITDMHSGILIQPRQPKEIAASLTFYESRPDTRLAFGIALKETISEEFLLSKMREKTYDLYTL
jgi:glycosyltransferase involved in cell wall biosynthesis